MPTTYWDFASDKPTGNMGLKADYKLKKIKVNVIDDSGFLRSFCRTPGTYNSDRGWQFSVSNYATIAYTAEQAGVYITLPYPATESGVWNESSIMSGVQFDLSSDFGMTTKDLIGVVTHSVSPYSKTSQYCESFLTPTTHGGISRTMVMFRCTGAINDNINIASEGGSWNDKWVTLKDKSSRLQRLTWQLFITRNTDGGSQREDDEGRQFFLRVDRQRSFEVDYGTTIGDLLTSTEMPTGWKATGVNYPAIGNWQLATIGDTSYGYKKLSELPAGTPITGLTEIKVRY